MTQGGLGGGFLIPALGFPALSTDLLGEGLPVGLNRHAEQTAEDLHLVVGEDARDAEAKLAQLWVGGVEEGHLRPNSGALDHLVVNLHRGREAAGEPLRERRSTHERQLQGNVDASRGGDDRGAEAHQISAPILHLPNTTVVDLSDLTQVVAGSQQGGGQDVLLRHQVRHAQRCLQEGFQRLDQQLVVACEHANVQLAGSELLGDAAYHDRTLGVQLHPGVEVLRILVAVVDAVHHQGLGVALEAHHQLVGKLPGDLLAENGRVQHVDHVRRMDGMLHVVVARVDRERGQPPFGDADHVDDVGPDAVVVVGDDEDVGLVLPDREAEEKLLDAISRTASDDGVRALEARRPVHMTVESRERVPRHVLTAERIVVHGVATIEHSQHRVHLVVGVAHAGPDDVDVCG